MTGEVELDLGRIHSLVVAGWTGRDVAALEKHIRELEAIGVKRPKSAPIFYRNAASLLTTADTIEVLGEHSSGEIEYVIHAIGGDLFVGLGSDHTDRKAETINVSLSKQMCAKPVSGKIWRLSDLTPHWDKLVLRSHVHIDGERRLYQEGSVASMRTPDELIRLYTGGGALKAGTSMFCGTLAVHGGIKPATKFEMELYDPVLNRSIVHAYDIRILPDEG
ncbi:MAG: DUF2848 domain-containing protein [Pseudorhodoplanes sp.]